MEGDIAGIVDQRRVIQRDAGREDPATLVEGDAFSGGNLQVGRVAGVADHDGQLIAAAGVDDRDERDLSGVIDHRAERVHELLVGVGRPGHRVAD